MKSRNVKEVSLENIDEVVNIIGNNIIEKFTNAVRGYIMEIRLLNEKEIKTEEFYNDFLEGNINSKEEYFDGNVITIEEAPDFPIYIAKGSEDEKKYYFQEL